MADVFTVPTSADAKVTGLTPMTLAADVQRSVNFYELLGMELRGQRVRLADWLKVRDFKVRLLPLRASQ
jgi:hypothetical protein